MTFVNPFRMQDTAGQERFSSLSTAFFRGADAVLLLYDVTSQNSLKALDKWWAEFCDKCPLDDEEMEGFCCVVVGNKTDLLDDENRVGEEIVTKEEALTFLDDLIPSSSATPTTETIPNSLLPTTPSPPANSRLPLLRPAKSHSQFDRFASIRSTSTVGTTTDTAFFTPSSSFWEPSVRKVVERECTNVCLTVRLLILVRLCNPSIIVNSIFSETLVEIIIAFIRNCYISSAYLSYTWRLDNPFTCQSDIASPFTIAAQ
ncbi:Rab7 [Coprinopsis cinerea okayama7|uniref:Rab7 n=1 Tax=Coprinopsis cinerea (strain Okayama-7 / 130 / ATCC MYA-4618 / FGSC 9003) TaxID=240176 RepID=A8NL67_COPC7|nr:Rab7 [Coprinopsis cinerea okayama7\|eukprot:XP_001834625.2 Rab7 [Coprinopsis cinerea okayama7\